MSQLGPGRLATFSIASTKAILSGALTQSSTPLNLRLVHLLDDVFNTSLLVVDT